ncbi:MAG: hypothetical protein QM777_24030 [Pseudorhodoferax sp.]
MYVLIVWFALGVGNSCGGKQCAGVAMQEFSGQSACENAAKKFRSGDAICVPK